MLWIQSNFPVIFSDRYRIVDDYSTTSNIMNPISFQMIPPAVLLVFQVNIYCEWTLPEQLRFCLKDRGLKVFICRSLNYTTHPATKLLKGRSPSNLDSYAGGDRSDNFESWSCK